MEGYSYITAVNGKVACTPLESLSLETQGSGFKTVKQKTALVKLKVVFGSLKFGSGLYVYLRGDVITMPWVKEVFDVEGQKVILVPEDCIQMVST